jgi:uncharacterized protein
VKELLEGLDRPGAYPHPAEDERVVQTHISVVFLAGPYAYKVKKPVRFAFVDFSTLALRRRFCHAEVTLNRRLAPTVYHGVVPIVRRDEELRVLDLLLDRPEDPVHLAPGEEVVDFAVRMTRLPPARNLRNLLRRGELDGPAGQGLLERLALLLAEFHRRADRSDEIAAVGGFGSVVSNATANFDELEDAVGATLSAAVLQGLREHTERQLSRLRPLMERRARAHVPCDTHGDLRLGHVYVLADEDGGPDKESIVVIDCVEFNDRFRFADPMADLAFLVMELEFEGRPDLARVLVDRYLEAAGDSEGRELLPYYVAYRDVVRGKVRTLTGRDPAIPPPEQEKAAARATRHFLRALGGLAPPDERPALVLLGGLPGVGKSVLARALAETSGFVWIDTDVVRRELAAATNRATGPAPFEEGLYTPALTDATYDECRRRARALLLEGRRVLIEASFRTDRHRTALLEQAEALGVPALFLVCEADREVVRRRLQARQDRPSAGPSDADWDIYRAMERRWETPGPAADPVTQRVRGDRAGATVLAQAVEILRAVGLSA